MEQLNHLGPHSGPHTNPSHVRSQAIRTWHTSPGGSRRPQPLLKSRERGKPPMRPSPARSRPSMEGSGGPSWDAWDLGGWGAAAAAAASSSSILSFNSPSDMVPDQRDCHAGSFLQHHQTCLKLGKRQYYGQKEMAAGGKRAAAPPPRCQVEGCWKMLVGGKEYHRRHKVCEEHSKAPMVVVLGVEQRFCQQCSRFHAVSEFDDSKRSCRRRLAGHNERRRKGGGGSAAAESYIRNAASLETTLSSRYPCIAPSSCALSLLSTDASSWVLASDLSSRSSAALHELIAEHRATTIARQLFSERNCHRNHDPGNQVPFSCMPHQHQVSSEAHCSVASGWNQIQDASSHLTLDLMQVGSSFDIFQERAI